MNAIRDQLVLGLVTAAMVGLFVWLVAGPQRARLAQAHDAYGQLSADVTLRELIANNTQGTQKQLSQLQETLDRLNNRIPETAQLGSFLEQLADIGGDVGLRAQNIVPGKPRVASGVGVVPIEVSFESTCPAAHAFLDRIESLDRLVHVGSVDIVRADDLSSTLLTELVLEVYFDAP